MWISLIMGLTATAVGMKNVVKKRIPRDYFQGKVDKESVQTTLISILAAILGLFLIITSLFLLLSQS